MARFVVAGRSTVVGTAARAIASVFATAAGNFRLVEVALFNTTATEVAVALVRFTAATNVGTGLTEGEYDTDGMPPIATGFAGHTGDGTVGQVLDQATLGAAKGAGVIWTYGNGGIIVPSGTANGIGVTCPTGTGQLLDYRYTWDE